MRLLCAVATQGPLVLIAIGMLNAPILRGQQPPSAPKQLEFEVASIKANNGCDAGRGGSLSPSPGHLEMLCVTLQSLIQTAFGTFGDGATINTQPLHTEGGPSWMRSDFYSVSAKADGPVRTEMLAGPMLQVLLEERFQLKTHRENRETPVYVLTATKGGLKVPPLAEGACIPIDLAHPPSPPKPGEPAPKVCGLMRIGPTPKGEMMMEVQGVTLTQFAQRLSGRVDRTVVDKTEIAGRFNFHLEFAPEPDARGQVQPVPAVTLPPADTAGPGIFSAIQEQLGLKLSPEKGTIGFLIIDYAARPTAN